MGTDNLYWKKKDRASKRKSKNRGKPLPSFLIVCEGEKTEPNYFRSFRLSSAHVKPVGCGRNTVSLVKKAIEIREKAKINDEIYDQVWCVFDRDSFSPQNFNEAIVLAGREGIKAAYSNEAFELWYLLHFNYYDSAFPREKYQKMLSKLLNHSYDKKSRSMYKELFEKQESAIKNAKKLLNSYKPHNPDKDNPSTTVHKLVSELNKYLSTGR
ncbi:MAG: RloB domain-containing protein [Candidatus Aminicenantes bacterium]|nr:RloB domain-containing protein [Candidatus Aminicenantes bacterium]